MDMSLVSSGYLANSRDTVSEDKHNWMFIYFLTCDVNEKLLGRFKETICFIT